MSFQDRQYYGNNQGGGFYGGGGGPRMQFGFPPISPMVKILLIANVAIFIVQILLKGIVGDLFAVRGGAFYAIQIWRFITFQFLHASPMHLLGNMIGLYFLGSMLERAWGAHRFLIFYLVCGAVGGVVYSLATILNILPPMGSLVGASGGVLGLMVACAILFPHFQVFIYFFPVPIRVACMLFTGMYVLNVLSNGHNAGGDLCHLGGMATGFLWIMGRPALEQKTAQFQQAAQQKKQEHSQNLEYEVDRILAKVHDQGIHSLTRREKQILQQATESKKRNS